MHVFGTNNVFLRSRIFIFSFLLHRLWLASFTNFNQMEEFIASQHAGTHRIDARALLFDLLTFHFFSPFHAVTLIRLLSIVIKRFIISNFFVSVCLVDITYQ